MGYGNMAQRGNGIHLRQYSRVFIVQDSAARRIVYASVEIQGISHAMRRDVSWKTFHHEFILNFELFSTSSLSQYNDLRW